MPFKKIPELERLARVRPNYKRKNPLWEADPRYPVNLHGTQEEWIRPPRPAVPLPKKFVETVFRVPKQSVKPTMPKAYNPGAAVFHSPNFSPVVARHRHYIARARSIAGHVYTGARRHGAAAYHAVSPYAKYGYARAGSFVKKHPRYAAGAAAGVAAAGLGYYAYRRYRRGKAVPVRRRRVVRHRKAPKGLQVNRKLFHSAPFGHTRGKKMFH